MRTLTSLIIIAVGCISSVAAQSCPSGWKQSSSYCYFFNNNDTVSWVEAQNECQMRMGALLMIESTDEYTFIKNNIVNNPSGNGFWTSLNDRDNTAANPNYAGTGTWLWGNEEYPINSVLQAHWDKEPDNNDNEDCIAINLAATLSDEHCSSKMGYICELDNNDGGCPLDWLIGSNKRFFVSNVSDPTQLVTWDAANNLCRTINTNGQGTANLVTLDNPSDSNYFTINMPTSWTIQTTQKWWTDLSDKVTEGTYQWMNGDTYNPKYVNWTQEPNNIAGREHCGTILQKGTFSDRDCAQPNNYICRKQLPNQENAYKSPKEDVYSIDLKPLQQYYNMFGCGDWEQAGHKCYQVYSKPGRTWDDAKSHCQSVGAHLMKIENKDEMAWLSYQSKTSVMTWGGYWIGLTDTSGTWRWSDGTQADTSVIIWNHQPDDFSGSQDCALLATDGVSSDADCKKLRAGFICEKPQKSQNCPTSWLAYSSSCYYMASKWSTYREAMDKCKSLSGDGSGYLLVLNTQDEKTFIQNQMAKVTSAPYHFWYGLTDIIQEGLWQYNNAADNTPTALGLVVWNSEPNNWNGIEHCVSTVWGGRLNDANCAYKSGFICEKYAAGGIALGVLRNLHKRCDTVSAIIQMGYPAAPSQSTAAPSLGTAGPSQGTAAPLQITTSAAGLPILAISTTTLTLVSVLIAV